MLRATKRKKQSIRLMLRIAKQNARMNWKWIGFESTKEKKEHKENLMSTFCQLAEFN